MDAMLSLEPMAERWRTFGWTVKEIDGHDIAAVIDALDALPYSPDAPSVLIAHTIKGKGASFAEDSHLWHNNVVDDEVYAKALAELEKAAIVRELRRFRGNRSEAATALGIARSTIHRKIDDYGIDVAECSS